VLRSAYRVKTPMIAVILMEAQERLDCLGSGSLVIPTSDVDAAGMLTAKCEGAFVRVFQRDLAERTEPVEADLAAGSD
jgi:hypothetical protein